MSDEIERWRVIRHLLATRSDHRCELCGVRLGPGQEGTVHHRDPRGMGGTRDPHIDDLCNCLLLCGGRLGGVLGCHGHTESNRRAAEETGWIVRSPTDPADVPVVLYSGRRVLLARYEPFYLPPPDGIPYDLTHRLPRDGAAL